MDLSTHVNLVVDFVLGALLFGAGVYVGDRNASAVNTALARIESLVSAKAKTAVEDTKAVASKEVAAARDAGAAGLAAVAAALHQPPKV